MWKALCDIIHIVESAICLLTKLPQCGKYAKKFPQCGKFTKKFPQYGKYAKKTSAMCNV